MGIGCCLHHYGDAWEPSITIRRADDGEPKVEVGERSTKVTKKKSSRKKSSKKSTKKKSAKKTSKKKSSSDD